MLKQNLENHKAHSINKSSYNSEKVKIYLKELRNKNLEMNKLCVKISILDKMKHEFKESIKHFTIMYPELVKQLSKVQIEIEAIINEYEEIFNPKPSPNYQMYDHRPNFKKQYFKNINTKEKAYWLGFLFADGFINLERKNGENYYRMGIVLSEKDKSQLYHLSKSVGLNPKYIKFFKKYLRDTNKEYSMFELRWGDQQMAKDLIKLGMRYRYDRLTEKRVKQINLPELKSMELMLTFLLGFFDEDGTLGIRKARIRVRPNLYSSNKSFLKQLKSYFNIGYKISEDKIIKFDEKSNKEIKYENYRLEIGLGLYRELLCNYKRSLKRKRIDLKKLTKDLKTRKRNLKRIEVINNQKKFIKTHIQKHTLNKILEYFSPNKIANILNLSRTTVMWLIKEYNIRYRKDANVYYNKVNRLIRIEGKHYKFYSIYQFWSNHLEKLGKEMKRSNLN
ncbi:MAG: LAGLIDADG family homing endonuclease [Candidatus Lokiarchaeota archaeon]